MRFLTCLLIVAVAALFMAATTCDARADQIFCSSYTVAGGPEDCPNVYCYTTSSQWTCTGQTPCLCVDGSLVLLYECQCWNSYAQDCSLFFACLMNMGAIRCCGAVPP